MESLSNKSKAAILTGSISFYHNISHVYLFYLNLFVLSALSLTSFVSWLHPLFIFIFLFTTLLLCLLFSASLSLIYSSFPFPITFSFSSLTTLRTVLFTLVLLFSLSFFTLSLKLSHFIYLCFFLSFSSFFFFTYPSVLSVYATKVSSLPYRSVEFILYH